MGIQVTFALLIAMVTAVYGGMIGAFTIGLIKGKKHQWAPRGNPPGFVSVIIAVRNEADNMPQILDELHDQDFPADCLEVIVADDFSEDTTMAVARSFALQHPEFPLMLVASPDREITTTGKKSAIERAVAVAKGEILLFTDADTSRGAGWISSMVSGFGPPEIQMVLGPVYFHQEKNLLQKIQSLEFMGLMGTTAGSAALGFPVMCNGASLAYRRDAFMQTGGFGDNLRYGSGDDQFMMIAIRKRFGKGALAFNFDRRSAVGTVPEATMGSFLHQRLRWVSKSRGYRDPVVIFVGIITYLTHLLLLAGILTGFFIPALLAHSLLFWALKTLVEYPMVWIMNDFFGKKGLVKHYMIAQVFQMFYVPVAGMLGLVVPYRWKGRKG